MKLKPLKAYCAESSIHGIPYFSNDDIHLTEKIFWAIVTVISFICCLLLIGKIMVMVQEDLTVTYTSDISVPVTQIAFPSVTFCFELMHFGNVTYSKYHVVKEQLEKGEITVDDLPEDDLRTLQAISLVISDDFLLKYNASRIPTDDIADQIETITLSLRNLIVTSTFSDIYATLLSKIVGPSGVCYNFNMVDAQNLYKNIKNAPKMFKYVHNILYYTRVERYLRAPMLYKELNLTNPLKLTLADSHFELKISTYDKTMKNTLDEMMNTYDYYKFASPRVYINNPYEIYNRDVSSYYSNRRSKITYIVEPRQILIDDNLKDYGPEARGCYFVADGVEHGEDERSLKYFNIYTKGNCKQECLINRTLEVCGCVQFFMFHEESTRVCGIHDMACYKQVEVELDGSDLCKCFPFCGEIIYNIQRIVPDYVKRVNLEFFSAMLERTRKDNVDSFTIVKFRSISFFPYILRRQFTEIDFIAYTGGAFGLFLGISILSFVEIAYYSTVRMIFNWMRERKKKMKIGFEGKEEPKSTKSNYVLFYFGISTIHGMSQIVMDHRSLIERIFWFLCLGFSLLYCGISSYEMYEKFEQATIAITYDSDESSVDSIPFPAIFLSPEVVIPYYLVSMAWSANVRGYKQGMILRQYKNMKILHRYLVPSLLCNYRFALEPVDNVDVGFDDFLVWMILLETKGPWFKNQTVIWNDKYRPEMTEFLGRNGYGYAFNMMTPEKMYYNSVSENFTKIYFTHNFNVSEESKHLDPISYQQYPMHGHGRSNLKITLEKNKYIQYKSICHPLFFSVYPPFEFPGEYEDGFTNKFYYGQDLEVLITPEVIKSDESLKKFPPKKRNCFFEGEKTLKMFKVYTRRNCELECLTNYYLELNETQCVPYYVIRNQTHKICRLEKNYDIIFRQYRFSQNLSYNNDEGEIYVQTCGCLDTCNDIKYTVDVIETRLPGGISDDDNATMTLTFRYKNDKFLPLVRRISFTFDEFLCQAGGLLGLYAGISALSVVELLYFITIRPMFNFYRWSVTKMLKKV